MTKASTDRFVIESAQFAMLERALSVALPAAKSLGVDTGIFWLRDSIFAATPYASIGLVNSELEESSECIAISQLAARPLLFELRTHRVCYLERIDLVAVRDRVVFTFEYDRKSRMNRHPLVSRYSGSWRPRLTPREHYELLVAYRPYFEYELAIKEIRAKLRSNEDYGYVVFEDFPEVVSYVTVGRSFLLAFLNAAKDEDTTFRLAYYGDQRCIVCRAGDVIAVLSVID
ncbi:MAG: hypothetical protein KatS3mg015_3023 [Fimbriimonadales bacterium]|nr:MAG: hypothetical protein KatS3mg015_3023 [Fimbriimonadales bacterium]